MKKTFRTKTFDGITVITHADVLSIDPEASKINRRDLFSATAVYKKVVEIESSIRKLKNEIYTLTKQSQQKRNMFRAKKLQDKAASLGLDLEKQSMKMLKEKPKFEDEAARCHEEGTTHFGMRAGEFESTDHDELAGKLSALKPREVLSKSGEVIVDNRGRTYWKKGAKAWMVDAITELGATPKQGYAERGELSADDKKSLDNHIDTLRIAGLTSQDREAEKTDKLAKLDTESVSHRSLLEIKGTEKPLEATQTWYETKKAELETKYK